MSFCVIGIGRFGYHVATTLAQHNMDVLAIDSDEATIASLRDKVTHAVCMHVADEEALRSVGVEDMDTVIVAMGEDFAQSILITALLKQKLRVESVISRAITGLHKDILQLIGADHVVLPEQEMGVRLADKLTLTYSSFTRITKHFSISSIQAPDQFVGKSLSDINLYKTYHVMCVGKRSGEDIVALQQHEKIEEGDILVLAGANKHLERVAQL